MSKDMTNDSASTPLDAMVKGMSSRRAFIGVTGAGAIGLLAAACGSSSSSSTATSSGGSASSPTSTGTSTSSASGDAAIAALAASLEVLAVGTYKAALGAATGGMLGPVPPAVATFVQTAMAHHQAALDQWNMVITSAGGTAVSTPPADLKMTVDTAFGQVKDVVGAAKLALLLEQTAADTYLKAIPSIMNKDAITLAGALQSVDQEHAAILLYVLGMYPVPDVFQKGDKAYTPSGAAASGSASGSASSSSTTS